MKAEKDSENTNNNFPYEQKKIGF